jgi:predicted acyl esterase
LKNRHPSSPKIEEVKWAIPDVAHTFKKGHRLMIQVQSSWFPLVDRNPQKFVDIYTPQMTAILRRKRSVSGMTAITPSKLILPVLK